MAVVYSMIYGGSLYADEDHTPYYAPIDCRRTHTYGDWTLPIEAVSTSIQIAEGETATLSKLSAYVRCDPEWGSSSTSTITITLMVNGVATALTATSTNEAGQLNGGWIDSDTTTEISITSEDSLCYFVETTDLSYFVIDSTMMVLAKSNATTATWLIGAENDNSGINYYDPEGGTGALPFEHRPVGSIFIGLGPNAGVYENSYNVRTASTARNFQVYVISNTCEYDATYAVLCNQAATGIELTIPAGQTGLFSDSTHTAAFAVGDKLTLLFTFSAKNNDGFTTVEFNSVHLQMDSDSVGFDIVSGGVESCFLYNAEGFNTTQFVLPAGALPNGDGQPSAGYISKIPIAGTLSNLTFSYNFGSQDNGVDSGMGFYARTMFAGFPADQRINIQNANAEVSAFASDTDNQDIVAENDDYYIEFGLRHPDQSDINNGAAITVWSISASFVPEYGDEFGCTKSCDGSETYYSLVNKTLKMLGEDPDAPVYWTSAEIGRYVNDAYGDMAVETKGLEFIEAVTLTSDVSTGTMSSYVMQPFRVTFDDYKLIATSKYELDRVQTDWESLSGYVDRYMTGLNDRYDITTYKAWDGRDFYAREFFFNDGATTYTTWADSTAYVVGDRVKVTHADGYVNGFECISAHTSDTATDKPVTGDSWTDVWVPLSLMVWATKTPADLAACDEPEFPCWSHISIAYKAAAKALRKYGEQKNDALADAYDAIGETYWELVRNFMSNRTPEQTLVVGARTRVSGLRPWPWPPLVEV